MQRNNLKLTSLIVFVGVGLAYFMHAAPMPGARVVKPAVAAVSATELPQAPALLASAAKTPVAAEANASQTSIDPTFADDGIAGNGPEDPQAWPGAEAPPVANVRYPGNEGEGGNGADGDPQAWPGAEAPPVPTALRAHYEGTGATGAPAPVHTEG